MLHTHLKSHGDDERKTVNKIFKDKGYEMEVYHIDIPKAYA